MPAFLTRDRHSERARRREGVQHPDVVTLRAQTIAAAARAACAPWTGLQRRVKLGEAELTVEPHSRVVEAGGGTGLCGLPQEQHTHLRLTRHG